MLPLQQLFHRVVSGILCLVFLLTKVDILKLKKEHFKLDPVSARIQLNIGIPMALQFSITAIGTMILQAALNLLGSTVVALIQQPAR